MPKLKEKFILAFCEAKSIKFDELFVMLDGFANELEKVIQADKAVKEAQRKAKEKLKKQKEA